MVGRDCLLELGARNKTFKSGEGVGRESLWDRQEVCDEGKERMQQVFCSRERYKTDGLGSEKRREWCRYLLPWPVQLVYSQEMTAGVGGWDAGMRLRKEGCRRRLL